MSSNLFLDWSREWGIGAIAVSTENPDKARATHAPAASFLPSQRRRSLSPPSLLSRLHRAQLSSLPPLRASAASLPIVFAWPGSTGTMDQEKKLEVSNTSHTYKHHCSVGVDVHEIFVKRSRLRVVLSYIGIIFLLVNACQPLLTKESLSLGSVWNITFAVLVAKCLQYKPVKRESVVIMPAFGIQLEIHFWRFSSQ
uniref:Uncharacterized protein n=1 Tax=Zea mays TaxID=4577 RepID=A0A804QQI0_MAIZE